MNSSPIIARKAIVSGLVQGVYFRQSCKDAAQQHGVFGSATNLPNGSVEVFLEGEEAAVAQVLEWCHRGPEAGRVDAVEISEEIPQAATGFDVR